MRLERVSIREWGWHWHVLCDVSSGTSEAYVDTEARLAFFFSKEQATAARNIWQNVFVRDPSSR